MHKRTKVMLGLTAGTIVACGSMTALCFGIPCFSTGLSYGLWLDTCPASDLRLAADVTAQDVGRGVPGHLVVDARALWMTSRDVHGRLRQTSVAPEAIAVRLQDADGDAVEGLDLERWSLSRGSSEVELVLPEVNDGDYQLLVDIDAGFDKTTVALDLPLYTKALGHVLTDRPLYEPGNLVQIRGLLLGRLDLAPLDARPATVKVRGPGAEVLLEEKLRTDGWGVLDTTFPLDDQAEHGTWTIEVVSGGETFSTTVRVEPFALPRFTAELTPSARWFGIGDALRIDGGATYASGAPVADATGELRLLQRSGRWPMPIAWEQAQSVSTDAQGRFSVDLGAVPADLLDRAELVAVLTLTDPTGETTRASRPLVLSEDPLWVQALSEMGQGLAEGYANRVYLLVSTPDGNPVRGAELTLTKTGDATWTTRTVTTDADGVAAATVDPGAPVTVVVPPAPVRVRPVAITPTQLTRGQHLTGASLTLAERRVLDGLDDSIQACGRWVESPTSVELAVRIDAGGAVRQAHGGDDPAAACLADALRRARFGTSTVRTLSLTWQVHDVGWPRLQARNQEVGGTSRLTGAIEAAARRARALCLQDASGPSGAEVAQIHWHVPAGKRTAEVSFADVSRAHGLDTGELSCVQRQLGQLSLERALEAPLTGVATVTLQVPAGATAPPTPRATTRTGYAIAVAASSDGEDLGSSSVILDLGDVPELRLRAEPALAKAGETLTVELLRGPDYRGALPKELRLTQGGVEVDEGELDADTRQALLALPDDALGFYEVRHGAARTVVYVAPAAPLEVALSSDATAYAPGAEARLTVQTTAGGQPVPAGVVLVGVDETLGQLAPLPGPAAYGEVTVQVEADEPAFGRFTPAALELGRIRGDNAARATLLRVGQLPSRAEQDARLYVGGSAQVDPTPRLLEAFYGLHARLQRQVRDWEAQAGPDDELAYGTVANWWTEAREAAEAAGEPATDAFGRPLILQALPDDLLDQIAPRTLLRDGTRLGEDVDPWIPWVRRSGGAR